jgi:cell division protein FtsQ
LILAGWLLYYSVESPYFTVRDIEVSGTKLLDPDQVRDAADVLGRNALLVRSDAVEQAVLRLTTAREAEAVVTLAGRVRVEVAERTPLVQWQAREGSFLVDREGVVFSRQAPPGPTVVVRDVDGPALEIGGRVDPAVLASVDALNAALPPRTGIQPSGFDYSHSSGITVPVQAGPRIIFGDASDLESKLASLAAIRDHLDATKMRAELIDLRFKGRPVYVLVPTAPAKPGQTR